MSDTPSTPAVPTNPTVVPSTPVVQSAATVAATVAASKPAQNTDKAAPAPATQNEGSTPAHTAPKTPPAPTTENEASTPTPAPTKTGPVVTKAVQPSASTSLEDDIAAVKSSGSADAKALVAALESYQSHLRPGIPVDGDAGARYQYALWRTIRTLTHDAPASEFKPLWTLLLQFAEENKTDVFADRYIYRFSEFWTQSEDELKAFQRILNLIKLTSDPKSRPVALKQVNLNATLASAFSEAARQRLLAFYTA